ncbi:MAG: hypothetical protein JW791_00635 [Nanoarchaeota archaeon]|nr:hypothetical protein [Nanoarchaeota archaeon]
MALSDFTNVLSIVFSLFDKLAFLVLCFFFGSLVYKGWKGKKNFLISWLIIALSGLLCFFGGLILEEMLEWDFFASNYITSLLIAVILFVITYLISSGFKVKEKYVTKQDVNSLSNDIRTLKIQVAKLTKALEDKHIVPEPLVEADIKSALSKNLEKKGVKRYEILSLTKVNSDYWSCIISSKAGREDVIIDAYTGSITQTRPITNPFQFLYKNPLSTLGFLLLTVLIIFLSLNVSVSVVSSFENAFDFSFLFAPPLPEGCVKTSLLLEDFKNIQVNANFNNTLLESLINTPESYMISDMTRAAAFDSDVYFITTSYNTPVSSIADEITISDWENIYNVRICNFKDDYTLCDCLGGEQTDLVFTVPYLIELGFIEQALQNIILDSLTGLFR